MGINLGRLETVSLREAWEHEANDFTPWLAQEENLVLLGETLGIELELVGVEQSVGEFYADILCKNTITGHTVLIENQLARTDHNHLGQIITYSAGLNARTVVWISANIREEHRAAIDWLNENTVDSLEFFGVEVEVWKIGNSALAPKFNLVAKPNDWSKAVSEAAHSLENSATSETRILQKRYWSELKDYILSHNISLGPQKPSPRNWTSFSLGKSGIHIAAVLNSFKKRIAVEIYISSIEAKNYFRQLQNNKDKIELEIGTSLEWQELPDSKAARIVLYKENTDYTDEHDWPNQHQWIAAYVEKFNKTFRPLVKKLE